MTFWTILAGILLIVLLIVVKERAGPTLSNIFTMKWLKRNYLNLIFAMLWFYAIFLRGNWLRNLIDYLPAILLIGVSLYIRRQYVTFAYDVNWLNRNLVYLTIAAIAVYSVFLKGGVLENLLYLLPVFSLAGIFAFLIHRSQGFSPPPRWLWNGFAYLGVAVAILYMVFQRDDEGFQFLPSANYLLIDIYLVYRAMIGERKRIRDWRGLEERFTALLDPTEKLPPRKRSKSPQRLFYELLILIWVVPFLLGLVIGSIKVDDSLMEMEPTFYTRQYLLASNLPYFSHSPERGDVVFFKYPDNPSKTSLARIIGLPGEKVEVKEGQVFIDGMALNEPYIRNRPCYRYSHTVPEEHFFVLGDNRGSSFGSYSWGMLSRQSILGKVLFNYWPPNRWEVITNPFAGTDKSAWKHADQSVQTTGMPSSQIASVESGDCWLRESQLDKAITEYRKVIETDVSNIRAYTHLGKALLYQLSFQEAISQTQAAIKIAPDSAEAHASLCRAYDWDRQFDRAVDECRKAIELDPNSSDAHSFLGEALADKGLYKEGLAEAQEAVQLDSDNAEAHRNLGFIYAYMEEWDKAVDELKQAIALKPNFFMFYSDFGFIYVQQRKLDQAFSNFDRANTLCPQNAAPYNGLGWAYLNQRLGLSFLSFLDSAKYEQAIDSFTTAIELSPKFAEPHIGLGWTYYLQGKYEQAIAEFNRAIELSPRQVDAYNGLGETHLSQKKYEEARGAFNKALEIDPGNKMAEDGLEKLRSNR